MHYMNPAKFYFCFIYLSSVLWYAPTPTREPWKETASTECLHGIEKRGSMCMSYLAVKLHSQLQIFNKATNILAL